jgi:DNA repair photolyase
MPGINDAPEQVERIVALAAEAGAVHVGGTTLFLPGAVRELFFDWLRAHRPDLEPRYRKLYARGSYAPADERRAIERASGAPWTRQRGADRFKHRAAAREAATTRATAAGPGEGRRATQPSLF